MLHTAIEWRAVLGTTPLEIAATLCAIIGLVLIARQNPLGWPLGMVWAGISAWLAFFEWQLVSDAVLYASYLPIQLYCWITWKRSASGENEFRPTWLKPRLQFFLLLTAVVSIVLWGLGVTALAGAVAWIPEPSLLWRDASGTVLNYFAQFLQARKRMDNWVLWLAVNLLGMHIYWVKGSPIYSVQYAFFLILGIYGWIAWHRSMKRQTA